jgi:hypothetical protein
MIPSPRRRDAASSKDESSSKFPTLAVAVKIRVEYGSVLELSIPSPFPATAGEIKDIAWKAFSERERGYLEELELLESKGEADGWSKEDFVLRITGSQVFLKNAYSTERILRTWRLFGKKGELSLDLVRKNNNQVIF